MATVKLYAPKEYWDATEIERKKITNGCGSEGWKGALVPNDLLGVDIKPACDIHDWMYSKGKKIEDKDQADRVFLNNMVRIINCSTENSVLKKIQLLEAKTYYEAVCVFGGDAFWEGKNSDESFKEVIL
jgi:hypothetical protein